MLESLIILYILLVFIFPFHSLAITLGAGTAWFIYRGYFLLKSQPVKGKSIIWLALTATVGNFILSILLGGAMASLVFYIIYPNYYLFLFNFAFCALISLRWFDFSHRLYQARIADIKKGSDAPEAFLKDNSHGEESIAPVFAMCMGLGKKTGMGIGMVPIFIDSGYLYAKEDGLFFDGVFFRYLFDGLAVLDAEKVSSEKIRVFPRPGKNTLKADAFLLILRYRFYPFKMRNKRDTIFNILSASLKTSVEGVPSGAG